MLELTSDRPLLTQIYDWMKLLGYCSDSRDFSKQFVGRSAGYAVACKSMGFRPSPDVFLNARGMLIGLASHENCPARQKLLAELVLRIDEHLHAKTSLEGGQRP